MSVEKLFKFIESDNIAADLPEETLEEIAQNACDGYAVDEESCEEWIKLNKEALKMIKSESKDFEQTKSYAHSKVIYPLLKSATIQLASRLIPHLVRNNRVVECAVLGPDPDGMKAQKAEHLSNFLSYDLLIDSDSWLKESHKLLTMLSAWGTAYRKVYYDESQDKVLSEVLSPEDVIINTNTSSIEKCRRITVKNYMMANDIVEFVRAGRFIEIDPKEDLSEDVERTDEVSPVFEILEQFCYYDLDKDGYEEPYVVFFHKGKQTVLGMYAAYDSEDIHLNDAGKVKKIVPKPFIIDYHCIDDPEGKYHSLGLNNILFHQNKGITSILRQLIDSGSLANQQGGFITKAFKTKNREIKLELGKYVQVEVPHSVDIKTQIMSLPFKEPSQVLFSLLGLLIESGKETGFITDNLTGDSQGQNVPATTQLSIIEQGTRAFKPMIQKLYHSLKKEFKQMYYLYGRYSNHERFIKYYDTDIQVGAEIFNNSELDILPVADPTQSSEAHKYMKIQAVQQMLQTQLGAVLNPMALATRMLKDLQIENPDELLNKEPPPPDPKMQIEQMKLQLDQERLKIEQAREQREQAKTDLEQIKTEIKRGELVLKQQESDEKQRMMLARSHKDQQEADVKKRLATVAEEKIDVERERLKLMSRQQHEG